jgi:hypothetical protein
MRLRKAIDESIWVDPVDNLSREFALERRYCDAYQMLHSKYLEDREWGMLLLWNYYECGEKWDEIHMIAVAPEVCVYENSGIESTPGQRHVAVEGSRYERTMRRVVQCSNEDGTCPHRKDQKLFCKLCRQLHDALLHLQMQRKLISTIGNTISPESSPMNSSESSSESSSEDG